MRRKASLLVLGAIVFCAPIALAQGQVSKADRLRSPVVRAVEVAGPAVVNISTEKLITSQSHERLRKLFDQKEYDKYFERFRQHERSGRSLGSGVIIDSRGYIVTNEHVVRRASKINIRLKDKRTYQARLISADSSRDLAVIKIIGTGPFPVVNLYRSQPLLIGETAIAVGNPFGLETTVTTGVISATGRSLRVRNVLVIRNLIQTDASINPGNSGGALLDINGDLIGINTAIKSGAEGIGFAIPVDEVRKALVNLLDYRRLSKVWVGVGLVGMINRQTNAPIGLQVTGVQPASPAAKAGLQPRDIIVGLNGRKCVELLQFELDILERKPGDVVTIEGFRERRPFKAQVTLQRLPMTDPVTVIRKRLGLVVKAVSAAEAKKLGLQDGPGLVIDEVLPKGPAAEVGLKKSDVIALFATFRVDDVESLYSVLEKIKPGDRQVVVLFRKGTKYYTWIRPR